MRIGGFGVKPINSWDDMAAWLTESFHEMTQGSILDLGPQSAVIDSPADNVVCAQVRKLDNEALWSRVSDRLLGVPLVMDLRTQGLTFGEWHTDDLFEDCSEGQIFSWSADAVADLCVSWFRD